MKKKRQKQRSAQDLKHKKIHKKTWPLIIVSGFLSFLMHPTIFYGYHLPDLGFFAWIFLIPLIFAFEINTPLSKIKMFYLSFISTAIAHLGTIYWLYTAMKGFGGLNSFEASGVLMAHVLIFGSLFALFFALTMWIKQKTKLPYYLVLPVFLTLKDLCLHYIPFNGFTWGIPPYSQASWLPYFQWIDHTGTLGLGFLIYLVNALLADSVSSVLKLKRFNLKAAIPLVSIIVIFGISLLASNLSLKKYQANKKHIKSVKIALIQSNVNQAIKWNPKHAKSIVKKHGLLTKKAWDSNAELVLWPETSYPYGVPEDQFDTIKFLNRDTLKAPMLIGTVIYKKDNNKRVVYNGAIHVDTNASIVSHYKKIHLVPFGEYLPFEKYLGFMKSLTQGVGVFTPGKDYTLFDLLGVKWAPLICFEDIFTRYSRRFKQKGADVLVNFTNDAWYGDSSMQDQHLTFTQFRALENRLPLIRATNNGLTAVIDATGSVVDRLEQYQTGLLLHELNIEKGPSFFSKHGQPWIIAIFLTALGLLGYALIIHKP